MNSAKLRRFQSFVTCHRLSATQFGATVWLPKMRVLFCMRVASNACRLNQGYAWEFSATCQTRCGNHRRAVLALRKTSVARQSGPNGESCCYDQRKVSNVIVLNIYALARSRCTKSPTQMSPRTPKRVLPAGVVDLTRQAYRK